MLHGKRIHNIATFTDLAEMVKKMKDNSWTLCTGFRFGKVLLLNDATSEDAIQEYAVALIGEDGNGLFVDSYTIDWMEHASLAQHVADLDNGTNIPTNNGYGAYTKREHSEGCRLCA